MAMDRGDPRRPGRFPLVRRIEYERSALIDREIVPNGQRRALTINVSDSGMCLLMDYAPAARDVLRLRIPMVIPLAKTPTLAEVCWIRELPFSPPSLFLVGLRFLL